MPSTTSFLGLLTWALVLSSCYAAKTGVSSAKCTVIATGSSSKIVTDARAKAVKDVSQYLCGGKTKTTGDGKVIATDTATAWAKAVAAASIDCSIIGTGSVKANAHAKAKEAATVWLDAYAKAVATAEVCGKCKTYAEAQVAIHKKVLLKAVAEVNISVDKANKDPNTTVKVTRTAFVKSLASASVSAFAQALATAKDDKNGVKCQSDVNATVGTNVNATGGKNKGKATAATVFTNTKPKSVTHATAASMVGEAVDEAGWSAAVHTCTPAGLKTEKAKLSAKHVATAVADAFACMLGDCKETGNWLACARNDGFVTGVANDIAKRTAESWLDALKCKCSIDAQAFGDALGSVIDEHAANVYWDHCMNNLVFSQKGFESDFNAESEAPIAKAFVDAYAATDHCKGGGDPCDGEGECVEKQGMCVTGKTVLGCCDDDYLCIKLKSSPDTTAKCRNKRNLKKPKWVALTETCPDT